MAINLNQPLTLSLGKSKPQLIIAFTLLGFTLLLLIVTIILSLTKIFAVNQAVPPPAAIPVLNQATMEKAADYLETQTINFFEASVSTSPKP